MALATKAQGLEPIREGEAAPADMRELQKGDVLFNPKTNCIASITQRLESEGKGLRYGVVYRQLKDRKSAEEAKDADAEGLRAILYRGGAPGATAVVDGERLKIGKLAFGISDFVPAAGQQAGGKEKIGNYPIEAAGEGEKEGAGKQGETRIGAEYDYGAQKFRLKMKPVRLKVESEDESEWQEGAAVARKPELEKGGEGAEEAPARKRVRKEEVREYADNEKLLEGERKGALEEVRKEYEKRYVARFSDLKMKESVGGGLDKEEREEYGRLYDALTSNFRLKARDGKFEDERLNDEVEKRLAKRAKAIEREMRERGYRKDEKGFYLVKEREVEEPAETGQKEAAEGAAEVIEDKSLLGMEVLRGEEAAGILGKAAYNVIAGMRKEGRLGAYADGIREGDVKVRGGGVVAVGGKELNNRLVMEKIRKEAAAMLDRMVRGGVRQEDVSLGQDEDGRPVVAFRKPGNKE